MHVENLYPVARTIWLVLSSRYWGYREEQIEAVNVLNEFIV